MATIVLNDVDPMHQMQLKSELLRQGHIAWLADDLGTVNALLNDVPINLMILI